MCSMQRGGRPRMAVPIRVLLVLLLARNTIGSTVDQLFPYMVNSWEDCMSMETQTTLPADAGPTCNRTYDTILCWVEVPVNTTAKQPCPTVYYDDPSTTTAYAYKFCELNGTYNSWTNYSSCWVHEDIPDEKLPQYLQYLQIVYSIGYSLSLLTLTIAMGIFLYFKKLRCPRNTIHMHLFMSFILRAVFMFVRDIIQTVSFSVDMSVSHIDHVDAEGALSDIGSVQDIPCNQALTVVISICQYALVSNYYWLLVEGVYLHALITLAVFSESSSLKLYIALGWGVPILFVLPWVIVQEYTNVGGCWFASMTGKKIYWIIKAPVMCSVVINFVLFLNILRVLATKLNATNAAEARSKLAKSTLVLIPLFGVYYIVTIGMYATDNPVVVKMRMYIELGLSSFQGFLVAVLYCFMNGEVRAEIRRKWRVRQLNRTLSTHRSLRNGQSRASFSTPSRQDSLNDPHHHHHHQRRGDGANAGSSSSSDRNLLRAKLRALGRQAFGPYHNLNGHVGNGSMARPSQTAVSEIDNDSDSNERLAGPRAAGGGGCSGGGTTAAEARPVTASGEDGRPLRQPSYSAGYRAYPPGTTPTVVIDEAADDSDSQGEEDEVDSAAYRDYDDPAGGVDIEIEGGPATAASGPGRRGADCGCGSPEAVGDFDDRRAYPNIETEV